MTMSETHRYTEDALVHSAFRLGLTTETAWISTADISSDVLSASDALWLTTGGPHKDLDKALVAIRIAREQGLPCLGTCGGFQHMIVEYARNVLKITDAQHAEYNSHAQHLVISQLPCSLRGKTLELSLSAGSRAAALYGCLYAKEQYYCSFGINPDYIPALRDGPFQVVGCDARGEIRVMEIPDHPFFLGTLFVPQARSTMENPHPIISGFLAAAARIPNLVTARPVRPLDSRPRSL